MSVRTRVLRRLASTAEEYALRVNFALPDRALARDVRAHQVDLCTTEGAVGVLGGHVPTVFQLQPGVVRVLGADGADVVPAHFAAGGFAVAGPDGVLSIAALEAVALGDIDAGAVEAGVRDVAERRAGGAELGALEQAELAIRGEVYDALSHALSRATAQDLSKQAA